MTQSERKTYLLLKFGTINNVFTFWIGKGSTSLSSYDDNMISEYFRQSLYTKVDKSK